MLSWVSVDLRTGRLLAELPDLSVDKVSAVLCSYTSTTATLPLPTAPENWERATMPEATALILLDDDRPVWGGRVTTQQLSMSDEVSMSLASFESYFDRRYVGDVTYAAVGQNAIVADLIDLFVNDGTINVRVEYTGAGQVQDRTYKDSLDKTVLSVLTELAGVEGGPEWTVGWEWQHSPERITPVLYVGDRIGTSPIAGLGPAATFEAPGPVVDAVLTRDFRSGKGANDVMAVSTAIADVRPQSRQVAANSERPTLEHRFTPSTSITEVSTLTSHAQRALSQLVGGAQSLTLAAVVKDAPRLGLDWFIGDDIGYQLGGLGSSPTPGRTNYATDPRATNTTVLAAQIGWMTNRWFGSPPATGTHTLVTGAGDGPSGTGIATYLRKTWTTAPASISAGADSGFQNAMGGASGIPVTPGATYTFSSWLRASVRRRVQMSIQPYNGATALARVLGTESTAAPGQWTRVSTTYTVPATGVTHVAPLSDTAGNSTDGAVNWTVGATLDGTGLLVEMASTVRSYADGFTLGWSWNGAANASTSTLTPIAKPLLPAFGSGISGSARCIGWELTLTEPQIIAPILADGDLTAEGVQ